MDALTRHPLVPAHQDLVPTGMARDWVEAACPCRVHLKAHQDLKPSFRSSAASNSPSQRYVAAPQFVNTNSAWVLAFTSVHRRKEMATGPAGRHTVSRMPSAKTTTKHAPQAASAIFRFMRWMCAGRLTVCLGQSHWHKDKAKRPDLLTTPMRAVAPLPQLVQRQSGPGYPRLSAVPHRQPLKAGKHLCHLTGNAHDLADDGQRGGRRQAGSS